MEKALEELQDMKSFRISLLSLGLVHEFKEAGLFSSLGALTNFSLKIPNIFTFFYELTSNDTTLVSFPKEMPIISVRQLTAEQHKKKV